MGDRYFLKVKCKCGFIENDVTYSPTCGFMTWECPKCKELVDLEEYSGIDAEGCATTEDGVKAIKRQRERIKEMKKRRKK